MDSIMEHAPDAEAPHTLQREIPDDENEVALRVKWGSSTYAVELSHQSTIADLKARLFQLTDVLPKRQKIVGLPGVPGHTTMDNLPLRDLALRPDQRLLLVGSRETDISNAAAPDTAVHVVNDLDVDYAAEENSAEAETLRHKEAYQRKLQRRIETTEFRIINPPRDGKKLLVLDLDFTLFDCRSTAESIADLGRPGLHDFLASAYCSYDIVVWSQTSWRWLEAKLTELSMLFSTRYKLTFVLDHTSMFSITSRRGRMTRTHEVKALEIIWRAFPGRWDATNTIHIDDLSKNFALNPQSGLKIAPFVNAPVARQYDRELFKLRQYLYLIAVRESDFTTLKHKHWKRYCAMYAEVNLWPHADQVDDPDDSADI